jgi:signal transduction histidine kinase
MVDERTRRALADVESQRDDAVVYLSTIKDVVEVLAAGHGVKGTAQQIAQVVVRQLGVESCAVALGERGGELALAGSATQAQRFGGPNGGLAESEWLSLVRLVGTEPGPRCFRHAPNGFTPVSATDLQGDGVVVLPFQIGGEAGGALVVHWLVTPGQAFARGAALTLLAEIVGHALTVARMRDAMERLRRQLEGELGTAREVLTKQEASLRAREGNIEQLTQALIRSNGVKRDFLGTVSHELRTPLNAILGYASLLREGYVGTLTPEQTSTLDRVLGSTRNLNVLIDDVLFFVQMEAERVPVRRAATPTQEIVQEVLDSLRCPSPDAVTVTVDVAPDAAQLNTDAGLLRRILFHLLGNAFKFTEAGEVQLSIAPADQREAALIVIRDTGTGIPPDRMATVFDLFTQGDSSTTRRYDGMGMGLTLVQRCVELLGGEVMVESQPGCGSVFRVKLPGALAKTTESRREAGAAGLSRAFQ